MQKLTSRIGLLFCALLIACTGFAQSPQFTVSFPAARSAQPIDGRLLLLLSTDPSAEPRMQIDDTPKSQIVFGMNVTALQPGQQATFEDPNNILRGHLSVLLNGYPIRTLHELPPGDYYVQALLNRYETFHRADGKTIQLAPDRGEGQHWNLAPGNLYSKPQKLHVDANSKIALSLDQEIPPIPDMPDTKFVRHIKIQSEKLTKFWGRPMFLSAIVLVPAGFDEHPQAHFPLAIFHDHFVDDFSDFRTTPPDRNLKPDYSERFHISGYNRIQQEESYKNYLQWIAKDTPRFLIVKIQHANPYYDDSYAVNSANLGPYGDAIEQELIPAIEKQFRAIGQGWARFVYGGSTGGWEALAVQVFHPDFYNGAFAACPDPIDFRAFTNIDLYHQPNAFYLDGTHKQVEQPAMRDYLGHTTATTRDVNAYELALGDHGRSGEQFDIWQAVYSPVGADGYPETIFDKHTGEIDHKVAEYWREHYDLRDIVQRNWSKIGPKLQGKIHLYVGSDDTYMLNDAVYLMKDFLKTSNPAYEGEVKYGPRAEHCWNGDPDKPNYLSRLHYNQMYMPKMMEQIAKTAPKGADLTSWRY